MKQNLYTIYDKTAECYMKPSIEINDETAVRSLQGELRKPEMAGHVMIEHASDFVFCKLGIFNNSDGTIESKVEIVIEILELVNANGGVKNDRQIKSVS